MPGNHNRTYGTPHILHDLPLAEGDTAHFHFDEFAATLARLIADPAPRTPLTIGVSGPWGSGKTTLLRRVEWMLNQHSDPKVKSHPFANSAAERKTFRNCKTAWFNAWKYADEDHLLAALVRVVLQAMEKDGLWNRIKSEWIDPSQTSYDYLGLFLNAFKLKFGGIGAEIEYQLDLKEYEKTSPFPTHTAFFDYFSETLEKLIASWLGVKNGKVQGALVIFIDDLDRCLPGKTIQVLEAVKLFLDKPGCIFVIGADINLIQAAVASQYKELSDAELRSQQASDYLEKIIQLRLRLPDILSEDMQAYLAGQDVDRAMQERWQALVAAAEVNTRRVKAVVNDLELQWYLLKNSGQDQGVNRDDFICWQALMRAAPDKFRERFLGLPEDPAGLVLRHQFIVQALQWMCGSEAEQAAVRGVYQEFGGKESKRLREVLKQIKGFSADFTPEALHAHVHLAAPPRPALAVEKAAAPAGSETLPPELKAELSAELGGARLEAKGTVSRLEGQPGRRPIGDLDFVLVPKGAFVMGSKEDDDQAWGDEKPQHTVDLPYDYWIAHTPVTNAQFERFMEASPGYRTTAQEQGSGRAYVGEEWKDVAGADWRHPNGTGSSIDAKMDHPVVLVSWHDAVQYCTWFSENHKDELGGAKLRLPSEAEWEKAARGAYGYKWPWGDEWDAKRCNTSEGGKGDTTPVGSYSPLGGDNPYGAADMAGNVWEWTCSLWGKDSSKPDFGYPYRPDDGRENMEASSDTRRVQRGGSFIDGAWFARCASRVRLDPGRRNASGGFRAGVFPQL